MKLAIAIDMYVAEKRERGFLYRSAGLELKAFGTYFPTHELSDVTARNIQDFLQCQVSPYLWHRKYHLLKRFFRYWELRDAIASVEFPPPRAYLRSSFRPYVYSHREIRTLVTGSLHLVLQRPSTLEFFTICS